MREGLRDLGRGALGVAKYLLANVLLLVVMFAIVLALGLAFGVVDRFNRWVLAHRVPPVVIVAVTVFLTMCAVRSWEESKAEQRRESEQNARRDADPPYPAG